jgi:hypothetical protein
MAEAPKVKGVVDIAILLDLSGSMQDCIDAVKSSIGSFISGLSASDANNESPVRDWRMKVCGYRDHAHDPTSWFIDNPFVSDVASVQAQLASPAMMASGGGDEPESLLDALYTLAKLDQSGVQDGALPDRWRARGTAARVIIFFTDATFKTPMSIPEAVGGTVDDVITALMANRIILCGFVPDWDGYMDLAAADKAEINLVATRAEMPALAGLGKPGEEGRAAMVAAVGALRAKASDANAFQKIMAQLAKTVTKSAAIELA